MTVSLCNSKMVREGCNDQLRIGKSRKLSVSGNLNTITSFAHGVGTKFQTQTSILMCNVTVKPHPVKHVRSDIKRLCVMSNVEVQRYSRVCEVLWTSCMLKTAIKYQLSGS